ncbi:type II toxin-antitoxin system RelE/ParE family toxin [Asticcacaulis benevestitus]|uniref:type II toxin-antitoxin system RelE/ParE family toxin n=1 Tax=Asticcacaulis benevestitus TaxID=347481 RepID=UPI0009DAC5C0
MKLERIYEYSLLKFGAQQADAYYKALHETFDLLAAMPLMGREFRGRRRHEHAEHIIFYRPTRDGILIVQLLHKSENVASKMR